MKGLGIFKILSQQFDSGLRMRWKDSKPCLSFEIATCPSEIVEFFVRKYEPTPIVIPWSGKDFFDVSPQGNSGPFSKPPTENGIVEAFLAVDSNRLKAYRTAIRTTLHVISELQLTKDRISGGSTKAKATKAHFMSALRSTLPDKMVEFIDVAALIRSKGIVPNNILGSGGGNDGRLHFGGNFMQCLWLCLPDFENQRDLTGNYTGFSSFEACHDSLFGGEYEKTAIMADTPGLFSPGGVGGPNAFEGFEAQSLRNPWDFILTIEGLTIFAGALSRRSGIRGAGYERARASFPFTCNLSYDGESSATLSETGKREVWLPLWRKPAKLKSIKTLFAEGRAEVSGRQAKNGIDFARAVASLGVDRGISEFRRFAIIQGRVGGQNYNTAAAMGSLQTRRRPRRHIRLLDDIDGWLNRLRHACTNESTSHRYGPLLRSVEASIYAYCKYGTTSRLQAVLRALGHAEQFIASAGGNRPVTPLSRLSPQWIKACNDGSAEYRIACSLASIYDRKVGPIREQMEPIRRNKGRFSWIENRKAVAWGTGSLSNNLAQVLHRRLIEGIQNSCTFIPIGGRVSAGLKDIHTFIQDQIDEQKLGDLLWGLITVQWQDYDRKTHRPDWPSQPAPQLSPIYALLKLCHLPGSLHLRQGATPRWRMSSKPDEGIRIPPNLELVQLLRAGRVQRAVSRAVHRLRASGLQPLGTTKGRKYIPDLAMSPGTAPRIPGALLVPIWELDSLARSVLRTPEREM